MAERRFPGLPRDTEYAAPISAWLGSGSWESSLFADAFNSAFDLFAPADDFGEAIPEDCPAGWFAYATDDTSTEAARGAARAAASRAEGRLPRRAPRGRRP